MHINYQRGSTFQREKEHRLQSLIFYLYPDDLCDYTTQSLRLTLISSSDTRVGKGGGGTNNTYLGGLLRVLMKSHMQFTWNTGGAQNIHFTSLMANFPNAWA